MPKSKSSKQKPSITIELGIETRYSGRTSLTRRQAVDMTEARAKFFTFLDDNNMVLSIDPEINQISVEVDNGTGIILVFPVMGL